MSDRRRQPLCSSKRKFTCSPRTCPSIHPISEINSLTVLTDHFFPFSLLSLSLLRAALLSVRLVGWLNRTKIGRNLWLRGRREKWVRHYEMPAEPETGRDSCPVHLEYSCSGFSLDVVCELPESYFRSSTRPWGRMALRNGYLSGCPIFVFIILITSLIFALSN